MWQASRSATPSGRTSPGEDTAVKSAETSTETETKTADAADDEPATVTAPENVATSQHESPVAVKREIKTEQEEGDDEGDEGADVFSQATAGEDDEGEEEVEDESKVKAALQTGLLGKGIAEEERRMAAESKRYILSSTFAS